MRYLGQRKTLTHATVTTKMPKAKVKVTEKDRGYKRIVKDLGELNNSYTTIGIHEGAEDYPNGASVQMVAAVHEFGTDRAGPKRRLDSGGASSSGIPTTAKRK